MLNLCVYEIFCHILFTMSEQQMTNENITHCSKSGLGKLELISDIKDAMSTFGFCLMDNAGVTLTHERR